MNWRKRTKASVGSVEKSVKSRDCTMRKKSKICFACGVEGHFVRDCTSRSTVNNVMMERLTVLK